MNQPKRWHQRAVIEIGSALLAYDALDVRELWLVDFTSVLVFRRSGPQRPDFDVTLELTPEETLASPLLPGFGLALADLYPVAE